MVGPQLKSQKSSEGGDDYKARWYATKIDALIDLSRVEENHTQALQFTYVSI